MKIMDIYRLSHDFDDYFLLSEDNIYYPKLLKVNMSEKVLNGHKYDNLYALEPTEHYFLTVDGDVTNFDKNKFVRIGLIVDSIYIDDMFYVSLYNKTNNIIYITKNIEV